MFSLKQKFKATTLLFFLIAQIGLFGQADLSVSNLQGFPNNLESGEEIYYTFDLNNWGDQVAWGSYTINKYLSLDQNYSEDDLLVGYVPTGNTPIGKIKDVVGAITVPENIQGSYYLIMVVDVYNNIFEKNELNNLLLKNEIVEVLSNVMDPFFCDQVLTGNNLLCVDLKDDGSSQVYTFDEDGKIYNTSINNLGVVGDKAQEGQLFEFILREGFLNKETLSGEIIWSRELPTSLLNAISGYCTAAELTDGAYVFAFTKKEDYGNFKSRYTFKYLMTDSNFDILSENLVFENISERTANDGYLKILPLDGGGFITAYSFSTLRIYLDYNIVLNRYSSSGDLIQTFKFFGWYKGIYLTPCHNLSLKYETISASIHSAGSSYGVEWIKSNDFSIDSKLKYFEGESQGNKNESKFFQGNSENDILGIINNTVYYQENPIPLFEDQDFNLFFDFNFQNNSTVPDVILPFINFQYIIKSSPDNYYVIHSLNDELLVTNQDCFDFKGCGQALKNDGFKYIGELANKQYFLSSYKSTWQDACASAEEYDAQLATITSSEINTLLEDAISQITYIGLNDSLEEGEINWESGEQVNYLNFDDDCVFCHSNDNLNDQVVMHPWNGSWSWTNKWSQRPFILELNCESSIRPEISPRLSVQESTSIELKRLFPNPTSGILSLELFCSNKENVEIYIYNLLGALVHKEEVEVLKGNNIRQLNISNLVNGSYYLNILSESEQSSSKFIKH